MESSSQEKRKPKSRGPAGNRAFYHVDTKGTCLLCLRERHPLGSKKQNNKISPKFCRVLLRYLNIDFHQDIVKPSNFKWKVNRVKKVGIELCQDCNLLAASFCEMYSQFELVQMRVNACVKTISDIMRVAGRIPSRVKAYQERMGIIGSDLAKGGHPMRPKAVLLVKNLRKELIQKSIDKNKSVCPQVKLTRCTTNFSAHDHPAQLLSNSTSSSCKARKNATSVTILTTPLSPIQLQFKNFLLAYVLSFATVWLLGTLSGGAESVPGATSVPLNAGSVGAIEDMPVEKFMDPSQVCVNTSHVAGSRKANKKSTKQPVVNEASKEDEIRKNSITITDSGKTVLLPHRNFKTDEEFVDESIMEYEDSNADLIDLSDDGFFAQANSLVNDLNMATDETDDHMNPLPLEVVKQEPQESTIEVNDRTCTECRIQLSCRAELEKHRSLIHKLLCYVQCPACKEMFSSYHFLKDHRKKSDACALDEAMESLEFLTIAKPLFPYSPTVRGNRFCPLEGCFEVFLKQENLQLHLKAHGLFSCSLDNCKMKFEKAHELALHESSQHSKGGQFSGYKCSRCSFHVGGQYQYVIHFLGEHLKINVFTDQCSVCRKGYLTSGPFLARDKEIHFRTHHDVKDKDPKSIIKCDEINCDAFFIKKSQLTAHKTRVHLVEQDSKLTCSICGVKILNQSIMIKHRLQAHSNLPAHEIEAKLKRKLAPPKRGKYSCMYCGNQYTSKYSLLIHSKVHDHLKAKAREDKEEKERNEDSSLSLAEALERTTEKESDSISVGQKD